jgi:hypothetical protein
MTVPSTPARPRARAGRSFGLACLAAAALGAALLAGRPGPPAAAADPVPGKPKESLIGGRPLFAGWPDGKKPDAVIVFSGQTFGYLQPCGCSRPQTGGLERRAVLIKSLEAKGWPVAGVDLGDLAADKPPPNRPFLADQAKLKYVATMNALRDMGYLAAGVGRTELQADLLSLLAEYALNKEQRPFTLAGNAVGVAVDNQGKRVLVPRAQYFPGAAPGATRPMVDEAEVAKVGDVAVGVAGVVGKALREENLQKKWADNVDFPDAKKGIESALAALAGRKAQLRVLIYQGPSADAAKVAADFPQFQAIVCLSDTDLPPLVPQAVKHKDGSQTFVVQVGHRGQHVGVLGAFKRAGGGFDLHYQLVQLGEEYITPGTDAEAIKGNKALQDLEEYAKAVRAANLLPQYPRVSHPAQIRAAGLKPPVNLTFVGTDACKGCHAAEHARWAQHPHSHAMATLEKVATRPGLRQFDGECVVCHSVGFRYKSGAYDPKNNAQQNLRLHDVGCESCHGPGSGHVAAPRNKDLLALLSPWKQPGGPNLPDAKFMKEMADTPALERGKKEIPLAQQLVLGAVGRTCGQCHDHEADPHFDLYKAWLKVDHTGLARPGGGPAVAPKK